MGIFHLLLKNWLSITFLGESNWNSFKLHQSFNDFLFCFVCDIVISIERQETISSVRYLSLDNRKCSRIFCKQSALINCIPVCVKRLKRRQFFLFDNNVAYKTKKIAKALLQVKATLIAPSKRKENGKPIFSRTGMKNPHSANSIGEYSCYFFQLLNMQTNFFSEGCKRPGHVIISM